MTMKPDPELVERAQAWFDEHGKWVEGVGWAQIPTTAASFAAEYAAERERDALERAAAELSLRGWAAASHRIRSLIPKPEEPHDD